MLENTIFQHLRRKYDKIFYFKEKNECDFLIKEKEKIIYAIQVCYELNEDNQKWINTSIKRNKTRQRHNNNFKSRRWNQRTRKNNRNKTSVEMVIRILTNFHFSQKTMHKKQILTFLKIKK